MCSKFSWKNKCEEIINEIPEKNKIIGFILLCFFKYEGIKEIIPKNIAIAIIAFSNNSFSKNDNPKNGNSVIKKGVMLQCNAHRDEAKAPIESKNKYLFFI